MKVLRDYQQRIVNDVLFHLENNNRCCVSLATGGGKTVVFSEIVNILKGRTLICVHREELVHQTSATVLLSHDLLISKTKKVEKNVCIAMVQTFWNRIKKKEIDVNSYDNIIIDECHRGEFIKILEDYKGKVIGLTATPNYEKIKYFYKCLKCGNEYSLNQKCCKRETKKYKQNVPLAEYYHTLIHGIEINELIEKGFLVKDENFILPIDTSKLVYNEALGKYTDESIALVYATSKAIRNSYDTYMNLAYGKKTIIFNPNTIVNERFYDYMVKNGVNAKMFDSKNQNENRHELVEWFKNTRDAVLLNVQVFTTGFDCTDVEVIFLNKKTKSLNLFLQMVGRGGRITDKIFKPSFQVIDMGNNINDLDAWSDKRDWNELFYNRFVLPCGKPQPAKVRTCHECETIMPANTLFCPQCGAEKKYHGYEVTGLPIINGKPVIPNPDKIIEYCEKNNLDCLNARKIVYDYVSKMFKETPFEIYYKHKASGNLFSQTQKFITPYYFAIQKSNLEGNRIIKITHFTNETIKKIERRYYTSGDL